MDINSLSTFHGTAHALCSMWNKDHMVIENMWIPHNAVRVTYGFNNQVVFA